MKTRNRVIDIMKGLMILSVMVYHLIYRNQASPFDRGVREMIYLSLPLFMLMSGYFYRFDADIVGRFKRRIRVILGMSSAVVAVLLVLFGPYYILVHQNYNAKTWLRDSILTFLRPELMAKIAPEYSNGGQLFNNLSPVWFMWTMAWTTIIFFFVAWCTKNDIKKMAISVVVLLVIGSILYVNVEPLSWSVHIAPLYAGIMLLGAVMKKYQVVEKISSKPVLILSPLAVVAGIIHFFIFDRFGSDLIYMSNLGEDGYLSAALFIVQTFVGGFSLMTVAILLGKVKGVGDGINWIGRHTLVILLIHCLIGGIVADILHTYNKPGPDWYVSPLTAEVVVKSLVSFAVSLAGCIGIGMFNDYLKKKKGSR